MNEFLRVYLELATEAEQAEYEALEEDRFRRALFVTSRSGP
jgi:hypothetical protein